MGPGPVRARLKKRAGGVHRLQRCRRQVRLRLSFQQGLDFMRFLKRLAAAGLILAFGLWLNNSALLAPVPEGQGPRLLAHRGVHQIYAGTDRSRDSCHAQPILPPAHGFIENTIPSMREAFRLGAEVVELDVHLTADGEFAVFHDWTLDCRTDGEGVTRAQPAAALKALDAGFAYSADGVSFPLRGTGIGLIPTLTEVFEAAPGGRFLINFKSRDAGEGQKLAELLQNPFYRAQVFGVYGSPGPVRAALAAMPGLRGYDRPALTACAKAYVLTGWSGHVPDACRNRLIAVPVNYAPWLWGWPHKFTSRMRAAGTEVILLGPYDGSGFSSGLDDPAALGRVPARFDGFIWTNRAEAIAPLLRP